MASPSPSYLNAEKIVATNEGGISKDKQDTGNYFKGDYSGAEKTFVATRFGLTFADYVAKNGIKITSKEQFDKEVAKFNTYDQEKVAGHFKQFYWDANNLDNIKDPKLAANIYDAMVNQTYTLGGPGKHVTLARTLERLGYGNNTEFTNEEAIAALNKAIDEHGSEAVNNAYSLTREDSYSRSGTYEEHGKGWLKRLNQFRSEEFQIDTDNWSADADLSTLRKNNLSYSDPLTTTTETEVETQQEEIPEDANDETPESEELKETIEVSSQEEADQLIQAYDREKGQQVTIRARYNQTTGEYVYTPVDAEGYTQEEIDELGEYFTTVDNLENTFVEREDDQGNKYYDGVFSTEGGEQIGIQKRFQFYTKPLQLTLPPEELEEIRNKKISEESVKRDEELDQAEKDKLTDLTVAEQTEKDKLVEEIETAKKAVLANPTDNAAKLRLQKAEEALQQFNNTVAQDRKGARLNNKVQLEKQLRDQLAEMQANPGAFTEEDIKNITAQIDKVSLEIAELQGEEREEGPFGNTTEDVKDVEYDDDELYYSSEEKEELDTEQEEAQTPTEVEVVPEEYITDQDPTVLPEVEVEENLEEAANDLRGLEKQKSFASKAFDKLGGVAGIVSGIIGVAALKKAVKPFEQETMPQLSQEFMTFLEKSRRLSEQGFSPAEEAKARQDIATTYKLGLENLVRGTAGDRAKFLAMSGTLDATRNRALLDFAAKDAQLNRQNRQQYGQLLSNKENMDREAKMKMRSERMEEMSREREMGMQMKADIAGAAFKNLMDEISYQKNYGPGSVNYMINAERMRRLYGVNPDGSPIDDDYDITKTPTENVEENKVKNVVNKTVVEDDENVDNDEINLENEQKKEENQENKELETTNALDYEQTGGNNMLAVNDQQVINQEGEETYQYLTDLDRTNNLLS